MAVLTPEESKGKGGKQEGKETSSTITKGKKQEQGAQPVLSCEIHHSYCCLTEQSQKHRRNSKLSRRRTNKEKRKERKRDKGKERGGEDESTLTREKSPRQTEEKKRKAKKKTEEHPSQAFPCRTGLPVSM